MTYPQAPTHRSSASGAPYDGGATAFGRRRALRPGHWLLPLVIALWFGLAATPMVFAQEGGADTVDLQDAHSKLSQEVNDTLVAVARAEHPLTSKARHLVEEGGVTVDEGGRLRLEVTLSAPLDDVAQQQFDELGVEIERLARDKQSFRAWVPADAVEDLASLKIVVHVTPG